MNSKRSLNSRDAWISKVFFGVVFFLCCLFVTSCILAAFTPPKFDKDVIQRIAERAVGWLPFQLRIISMKELRTRSSSRRGFS